MSRILLINCHVDFLNLGLWGLAGGPMLVVLQMLPPI